LVLSFLTLRCIHSIFVTQSIFCELGNNRHLKLSRSQKCVLLENWLSQKGSRETLQNWCCFFCLIKNFNEAEYSKNVFFMCLWPRLKFLKWRSNISGSRSWYQMKGLAKRNTYVKYESPITYESKLWPKLKIWKEG
jgi:hypothetical protein